MRLLFLATDFPSRFEPHKGVFNRSLIRALAARHAVRVVSPVPWPLAWRGTVVGDPAAGEAARIGRMVGAPSAVIVGGSDVMILPQVPRRRRAVQRALGAVDAVLAVSDSLRRKTIELGIEADKVFVWRQGLDTARFTPRGRAAARQRLGLPDDRLVFVWVGRLVPVKGLDVLIDACSRLRDLPFRLFLVGDGPLRADLAARVQAAGLADTVKFVGARDHTELPDWYSAADWTLLPSRSEGLPNVLRESLACGTPFIASDVGGVSEIVGDSGSRLVRPGAPAAWADAIRAALAGPAPQPQTRPASWDESADALVD